VFSRKRKAAFHNPCTICLPWKCSKHPEGITTEENKVCFNYKILHKTALVKSTDAYENTDMFHPVHSSLMCAAAGWTAVRSDGIFVVHAVQKGQVTIVIARINEMHIIEQQSR
jgi:hypothetical protein